MKAKLASALPLKVDVNGLINLVPELCGNPYDYQVAVVVLDVKKVETDHDTGEVTPTVRVRRIEPILRAEDRRQLGRIMQRAEEQRTGKAVLPLEMEDALRGVFGHSSSDDQA